MAFETNLTAERIGEHTAQGHWTGEVSTDHLDAWAARVPDKLAAVDEHRSTTYRELAEQVHRCAAGLLELGVGAGDVVSFQLPNRIEWLVLHFACTRIGAVSNPLIPIHRDREVGFALQLARSRIVVVPDEFRGFDHPAMVERLRPDLPDLQHLLVVGGESGPGRTSWEEFLATPWERQHPAAELARLRPDPDEVTLLIFTSGTTGEPKGVMHTHNALVAANRAMAQRVEVDSDSVLHMASTFAHLTGFLYGARLPVQFGATGVYQEVWDPQRFVELIEQRGITHTSAATPFLHDLLSADNLARHDVSALRRFCCMGAPVPRPLVRQAGEQLPATDVLSGWGQSENALVTIGVPGDDEDKTATRDGIPLAGMRIRVVDARGRPLPPSAEGRLQVRGPFLFVGYARRPDTTRDAFDGAWFDTGDLAAIDEDGYLSISGRTKDVIIRGGENIPVAYLEDVLHEHTAVQAAAVVGVPDPRLQERACAVVVPEPGEPEPDFAELQRFLAAKGVAKPYWPERLEVVGELPRTPSGKIQKFRLREQLGDEADHQR
ncbi:AMP-binding protein [Saccharopolyspora sp. HNM0983]|uniref:AMP-binding protein n=1 Tax=Saccharopolyspora montiporae TaxID=2781240 RepID=A0A929BE85_9PSEU|nr:AMP-binding protein [Saccharopolyspora sp. HNM0983]MBE9375978.1 AMP-binding protein [Saccharopolyspora sp. HNM0983]